MNRLTFCLVFFAGCVGTLSASPFKPMTRGASGDQGGWVVGWDSAEGLKDLTQSLQDFDEVSAFAYEFDGHGHLVPADDTSSLIPQIRATLRPGARLLISVVNDVAGKSGKQPALIRTLLKKDQTVRSHIRELLAVAAASDGIEVDYEALKNFATDDGLKNRFSRFIRLLAQALHAQGKWLAVDVEPEPRNLDWQALGQSVDEFKIMAYYDHGWGTGPGALITPKTLERILRYAQSQGVPSEKLVFALPTYGFDWTKSDGSWKAEQLEHEEASTLARRANVRPEAVQYDDSRQPHFSFDDEKGVHHEVWYADTESIERQKAYIVSLGAQLHYPVSNFAYWRLGRGSINYHRLRTL